MADHTIFDRVKQILTRSAPTRNINIPSHTALFGHSLRDAARGYVSVGVLVAFVGGITGPAVLAGTDDTAATPAQASSSAVLRDAQAGGEQSSAGSGGSGQSSGASDDSDGKGDTGDEPTGGGEPAPKSADPDGDAEAPAAAEKGMGGGAPAEQEKPAPAEPAAAKAAGGGAAAPAPAPAKPVDELDGWIRTAIDVMQAEGIAVSEEHIDEIRTVIEKESSGDPRAINNWDINAKRGTPSKGLMQTIAPTFNAYKLPGYDDIYNPVDNIIAGVRYTLDRYGSFAEHPGLAQMAAGGGYRGY